MRHSVDIKGSQDTPRKREAGKSLEKIHESGATTTRERISPEEFSKKIYPRFEQFVLEKKKKIERTLLQQNPKSPKITSKEFVDSVYSRFEMKQKESEQNKEFLLDQYMSEVQNKRPNSKSKERVSVDEFKNTTLRRFDVFMVSKEQKKKKILESKEQELENIRKGIDLNREIDSIAKKKLKEKELKERLKREKELEEHKKQVHVPAPLKEEILKKFEEFEQAKKRKRQEAKIEIEEQKGIDELIPCTFHPQTNRGKEPIRQQDEIVSDLYEWKKKVDTRQTEKKLKQTLLEERLSFHPTVSENSKKIYVRPSLLHQIVHSSLVNRKKHLGTPGNSRTD